MKALETKNLEKRFNGIHAIDGLSIAIEKGRITGIIGPNGSGKTTLINVLSGTLSPDGGTMVLHGSQTFTVIQPHQISLYGLTRTFQDVRLFEQMTVLDNLLIVLTERNVFSSVFEKHGEQHLKKAEATLQKVGLLGKKDHVTGSLSYGQKKLLEIGRTLAMEAEIYLFDEPFAGLFPAMRAIVSDIIRELKGVNRTVILVEHDMGLIRELCDFVFVMDGGTVLAEGEPNSVLKKKEVVEAYFGG